MRLVTPCIVDLLETGAAGARGDLDCACRPSGSREEWRSSMKIMQQIQLLGTILRL
jgi:hypothetical protein